MDSALKHRLIGAAVLSALAIIFLPKLIVGRDKNSAAADVPLTMPGAPGGEFQTRELPLVIPASGVPDGGVVGMDASHPAAPMVNTGPAVDANGQPLPAGVLPAPAATMTTDAAAPVASASATPVVPAPATAASATLTNPAVAPSTTTPAPSPVAATAPIPAASAGGHYVVSLGTYSNATNAQSLVASLKTSQLAAYAEPVNVGGKMQTRVRIGPFAQRGDAEAARLKAQQIRTDMPASVTALDAAAPAPEVAAPTIKPASVPATAKPSAPIVAAPAKSMPPLAIKPAPATAVPASANPVALSPAAAGRGYAVQVSAFRAEDQALTLRNKLRAAGFTAFSEKIQAESGTLYRVRIGPEADRDAADKLRTELSTKMGLSGMVVAYP